MDTDKFAICMQDCRSQCKPYEPEEESKPLTWEAAHHVVETTMAGIHHACNESIPQSRHPKHRKRPVHWWTEEIASLRKECLRAKRIAQRARRRDRDAEAAAEEYKSRRKRLRKAIRRSQIRSWEELRKAVDGDPWGLGYKIVTGKLSKLSSTATLEPAIMDRIVTALFPPHPDSWKAIQEDDCRLNNGEVPLFTKEELEAAASSLKKRKCPGPDSIPAEVLIEAVRCAPDVMLNMYNACLRTGYFHSDWKRANLVLISKGKGQEGTPSAYRPLCMLDTARKLLEKLIRRRLQTAIEAAGGLSERQFGFREGRSTVDAIRTVMDYANRVKRGNHFSRPICVLATLDIKNAFNSMRWDLLLNALTKDFKIPKYIVDIIKSYLRDRVLLYKTTSGLKEKPITAGAAQGSILGPDLWNAFYDGILRINMPENTHLVGYADDVIVVILERNEELAQIKLNMAMRRITAWLKDHGLELATNKTEIAILTGRRPPVSPVMLVGDTIIQVRKSVKYLGVLIDKRASFWDQIRTASDKAAIATARLSKLMANIGGPTQSKRRLLMSVTHSIMLYGAEIWADSMRYEKYRKKLLSTQRRGALRTACAYRTVSESAILVIAGVVPIDLLAKERKKIGQTNKEAKKAARREAREESMVEWEERWQNATTGRWTFRMITDLPLWYNRSHGETNFFLTQMLTGHGCFRAYLYKMGKVDTPSCFHCGHEKDDAEHTFFHCSRRQEERSRLTEKIGMFNPDNIVGKMIEDPENWQAVSCYAENILRQKKAAEEEAAE